MSPAKYQSGDKLNQFNIMANKENSSTSSSKTHGVCEIISVRVKNIHVKQLDKYSNSTYLNTDSAEIVRLNPISAEVSLFNDSIKAKIKELIIDKKGNIYIKCDNDKEYLISQQDDENYNIVEK